MESPAESSTRGQRPRQTARRGGQGSWRASGFDARRGEAPVDLGQPVDRGVPGNGRSLASYDSPAGRTSQGTGRGFARGGSDGHHRLAQQALRGMQGQRGAPRGRERGGGPPSSALSSRAEPAEPAEPRAQATLLRPPISLYGLPPRLTAPFDPSRPISPPTRSRSPRDIWGVQSSPYISAYDWTISHPDPRRQLAPPSVLGTNPSEPAWLRQLSDFALDAWRASAPGEEERRRVQSIVWRVEKALKGRYRGLQGRVEVFGSVSWGGECKEGDAQEGKVGDVDLVLRDFSKPFGYTPDLWGPGGLSNRNFPPLYNVYAVERALVAAGFEEVQPIKFATTPIVKFRDPYSGVSCDLNINDLGGWYNSSLILAYCRISPFVLRPLIHFVKLWAKRRNLNDPSGANGPATLSSYCLSLMCIVFLQDKGLLPNLQDPERVRRAGREGNYAFVNWGKPTGSKLSLEFADELKQDDPWQPDARAAETSLGQHILDFFHFWSCALSGSGEPAEKRLTCDTHPDVDARYLVFSVLRGGCIKRARPVDEEGKQDNAEELKRYRNAWRQSRGEPSGQDEQPENSGPQDGTEVAEDDAAAKDKPATPHPKPRNSRRRGEPGDVPPDPPSKDGQPYHWCRAGLVVQDPFLHEKNCARGIEMRMVAKLSEEFTRGGDMINDNPASDKAAHEVLLERVTPPLTKAAKRRAKESQANGKGPTPNGNVAGDERHKTGLVDQDQPAPLNGQEEASLRSRVNGSEQSNLHRPAQNGPRQASSDSGDPQQGPRQPKSASQRRWRGSRQPGNSARPARNIQ